jgi:hypothetical protein
MCKDYQANCLSAVKELTEDRQFDLHVRREDIRFIFQ